MRDIIEKIIFILILVIFFSAANALIEFCAQYLTLGQALIACIISIIIAALIS